MAFSVLVSQNKSPLGWDFSVFRSFNLVKIVTPCSISFGFLAGPWWDSEIEKLTYTSSKTYNEAKATGVHS